jgi:hypothetical protein
MWLSWGVRSLCAKLAPAHANEGVSPAAVAKLLLKKLCRLVRHAAQDRVLVARIAFGDDVADPLREPEISLALHPQVTDSREREQDSATEQNCLVLLVVVRHFPARLRVGEATVRHLEDLAVGQCGENEGHVIQARRGRPVAREGSGGADGLAVVLFFGVTAVPARGADTDTLRGVPSGNMVGVDIAIGVGAGLADVPGLLHREAARRNAQVRSARGTLRSPLRCEVPPDSVGLDGPRHVHVDHRVAWREHVREVGRDAEPTRPRPAR